MFFLFFFLSCHDPPAKALPASRLPPAIDARMLRYGQLRGYLVQKKPIRHVYLWQVKKLTPPTQKCAEQQLPANSAALLIEASQPQLKAQEYLRRFNASSITTEEFHCSPKAP